MRAYAQDAVKVNLQFFQKKLMIEHKTGSLQMQWISHRIVGCHFILLTYREMQS